MLPSGSQKNSYRFDGGYLQVFQQVTMNHERVGTLYLLSDMRQWNIRVKRYTGIIVIVVLLCSSLALLLSSRLQKTDFQAHFAFRGHHENGVFEQELRGSSHQILWR